MNRGSSDWLILILANAIWGATDVVAKAAVAELSPPVLAWLRLTIALAAFAPALWRRRAEIPRTLRDLVPFLGLGASGFFLNFVLHYSGLTLAPASHATALRVSEAAVIFLLSALILREHIRGGALLGLLLGTAGVLLVLNLDWKNLALFGLGYRLGDLLILLGILVEGFYTVLGKRALAATRPLTATALACLAGWALLTLSYGSRVAAELIASPPSVSAWGAAAYLGLFASAFGYWMWYRVLARRDSHRVGITILVQPVVGIPLAAVFFHEPLPLRFLLGAGLIALSGYLVLRPGRNKKAPVEAEAHFS